MRQFCVVCCHIKFAQGYLKKKEDVRYARRKRLVAKIPKRSHTNTVVGNR